MAVFHMTCNKPVTKKSAEQIEEEFDLLQAKEIAEYRWILAGDPTHLDTAFMRLREVLRRDGLIIREVFKNDLLDRGYLTEEEITLYRKEARESSAK